MHDIKTRDVVKGTIKAIDKSAVTAERMKDAYVRTKGEAEHGFFGRGSPDEYAAEGTETAAETAGLMIRAQGCKNKRGKKTTFSESRLPEKAGWIRRSAEPAKQSIKTVEHSGKPLSKRRKGQDNAENR